MAVNEAKYRVFKDAGFSHQAALTLSDESDDAFGGHFGAGAGGGGGGGGGGITIPASPEAVIETRTDTYACLYHWTDQMGAYRYHPGWPDYGYVERWVNVAPDASAGNVFVNTDGVPEVAATGLYSITIKPTLMLGTFYDTLWEFNVSSDAPGSSYIYTTKTLSTLDRDIPLRFTRFLFAGDLIQGGLLTYSANVDSTGVVDDNPGAAGDMVNMGFTFLRIT